MTAEKRITSSNWDRYDTRHAVFRPAKISAETLETGYWQAYRDFYRWGSIFHSACVQPGWEERLTHFAYVSGWKKFEPLWDWVIRSRQVGAFLPLLEKILSGSGRQAGAGFRTEEINKPVFPLPDQGD